MTSTPPPHVSDPSGHSRPGRERIVTERRSLPRNPKGDYRPTDVIVHRITLGRAEREMLHHWLGEVRLPVVGRVPMGVVGGAYRTLFGSWSQALASGVVLLVLIMYWVLPWDEFSDWAGDVISWVEDVLHPGGGGPIGRWSTHLVSWLREAGEFLDFSKIGEHLKGAGI